MAVYIRGIGNISPQKTWGEDFLLFQPRGYAGDRLFCIEPDYSQYINSQQLRRMSRIIKMGVAASLMALKEAVISVPDGVITGTGYGCLEDTGVFLEKMLNNHEQALNPTPFIQSTHNTIGSQIGLLLQCQGYNQTYTHEGHSFESALVDSILELKDHPDHCFLVGAVDEVTDLSHAVQSRFGLFLKNSTRSLDLFKGSGKGTINGEGAAYFVLSGVRGNAGVMIDSTTTFYSPGIDQLRNGIEQFLTAASIKDKDLDLILVGKCGDRKFDFVAEAISVSLFPFSSLGLFKHLCGEYPTSTAFAVALGARIIQSQRIPEVIAAHSERPIRNILIFNSYFGKYHSLILLKAC